MDERRTARVTEAIREELLEIIGFEMSDPRVRGVEVSIVEMSSDGRVAHIRVAARGDEKAQRQAIAALDKASGFLRHELAARLDLFKVPELKFDAEKHPDAAERVDILLKRAQRRPGGKGENSGGRT